MDDGVTLLVAIVVAVESVAALVAAGYIVKVYRERREDAPFLTRLVKRDVRVALGGLLIAVLVAYALLVFAAPDLGLTFIPRPWPSLIIAVAVGLMEWGVISDALTFYQERKS